MFVPVVDEVGVVCQVGHPAAINPINKDRFHQHDVVEMCPAAAVGIVSDEDIAVIRPRAKAWPLLTRKGARGCAEFSIPGLSARRDALQRLFDDKNMEVSH